MLLQSANADNVLWISDNPVVLQNTFPYGRVGVTAPGIEIYFPIGPKRCLALYCKSIGEQIRESLDPDHPRPRLSKRLYQDLLRGIDQGVTVSIAAEFVAFLNELQISQSSRFLYSARSDFDFANRILRGRPSLGTVTSLVKLGELGAAAPPFRDMPGTFLLLESGHTHHLLPVIDRSEQCGKGGIAVTILDELKFRTINAANVFDSASLIVDGHVMNLMREIVLASESFKGEQLFVVKHTNLGLQAIMETIHSQRSAQVREILD